MYRSCSFANSLLDTPYLMESAVAAEKDLSTVSTEVQDLSTVSTEVQELVVNIKNAASGTVLLEPTRLDATTSFDVLANMLLEAEEQLFVAQNLLVGDTKIPLEGQQTIAELDVEAHGVLDLSITREPRCRKLTFKQISDMAKVRDYVCELWVVSEGGSREFLEPIVEKFPRLESLTIHVGPCQRDADSSYWSALKELSQLKSIAVLNHHGHRSNGALDHKFLQSLVDWGSDGPKLTTLRYEGAMNLSLSFFEEWVDKVSTLSPDLETLCIQYWFANPALVNDAIFQKITKKWQRLRHIHLGSGCNRLSDRAFLYFGDNDDNIKAGLHLEKLALVCCTNINGNGWLEPESVKRNLPNLKEFELSASRQFCKCGGRGCGAKSHVKDGLEEIGVKFNHHTTHW